MTRVRSWISTHKLMAASAVVLGTVLLAAVGIGAASATDNPAFCRSACHEMGPYAEAWDAGPHADIACVECHVDPGIQARLTHKVAALKEVKAHVAGDVAFPLSEASEIPDERCIRCHQDIGETTTGFDHDVHASRGSCQSCHAGAGHEVTDQALRTAGLFNSAAQRAILSATVATVDGGVANVVGHVDVDCSSCHDMEKTGCDSCHDPKHETAGPAAKTATCTTCHAAGETFAFAHPDPAGDCADCHARPAKHRDGECSSCHKTPAEWTFKHPEGRPNCASCHPKPAEHRDGKCSTCHAVKTEWAFAHPSKSADCTECHTRPAKHRNGSCTTCHSTSGKWAFSHPSASSTCTSCHTRPAKHSSGACARCHNTGRSWAFSHKSSASCTNCHGRPAKHRSGSCSSCHRSRSSWAFSHPSTSSTCTNCHNRPSGHRSGSCATCHRTGASWSFRHPGSSSCASCHKAPSSHYGNSCASCHSPSKSWKSATFSHPRIPGGEHTYRSFSCGKCHPSGYGSHTCASCHDSASGPKDD
jgi:cytochrome c-type protein NapC